MLTTVEELRRKLRQALPGIAIKQNAENERSAVNPMYVIERLNDSFGESGWTADYKVAESNGSMIVVECQLRCWYPWVEMRPEKADIVRRAFGGNNNSDRGDAYKGACTDALTKAASHLGIAHQVYKGLHDLQPRAVEAETVKRDGRVMNGAQCLTFSRALCDSGKSQADLDEYLASIGIKEISQIPKVTFEDAMQWAKRNAVRIA